MLGMVLAMVKMSACRAWPSAAASSSVRTKPLKPGDDGAGGHHRASRRAARLSLTWAAAVPGSPSSGRAVAAPARDLAYDADRDRAEEQDARRCP